MILSDKTLKQLLDNKIIVIEPLTDQQIQSASIDLKLGTHFLVLEDKMIGLLSFESEIQYNEVNAPEIIIPPRSFILATTKEFIKLPNNITAFVEGRSSVGRMGLFVQNAGWIDPGFAGKITLELYNAGSLPIRLSADWRICQLVFCKMDTETLNPYRGKYQGQNKAVGSKLFKDKYV